MDSKSREAVCTQVIRSLKNRRLELGLSMTEVAARAGLSRAMISFVERGLRNPTLDTLLRITGVLDVELGKLITKTERRVC